MPITETTECPGEGMNRTGNGRRGSDFSAGINRDLECLCLQESSDIDRGVPERIMWLLDPYHKLETMASKICQQRSELRE